MDHEKELREYYKIRKEKTMDWNEIWAKIKMIFSELWPVIWPTIKIILTEHGKAALNAAINVVKQVQETMPNATGAEKAAAALAQLTALLVVQGIDMGQEMLRAIIKIAYEHMVANAATITEAKMLQDWMAEQAEPLQEVQP